MAPNRLPFEILLNWKNSKTNIFSLFLKYDINNNLKLVNFLENIKYAYKYVKIN